QFRPASPTAGLRVDRRARGRNTAAARVTRLICGGDSARMPEPGGFPLHEVATSGAARDVGNRIGLGPAASWPTDITVEREDRMKVIRALLALTGFGLVGALVMAPGAIAQR